MPLNLPYILLLVFQTFGKPNGRFTLQVNPQIFDGFIGPN